MATLSAIRTLFRAQISQSDSNNSDISDSEANNFANQACRYAATLAKWPRDHAEWTIEGSNTPASSKDTYDLPSDFISVISVKMGSQSTGDVFQLKIMDERELDSYRPGWMNRTSSDMGKPDVFMLLDRYHFLLSPSPNNDTNGKKVIMTYVYYPATLVNDSDVPDLPLIYHDILPFYMASLAYGGELKNPELAIQKNNEFLQKIKSVELTITSEKEQMNLSWGNVPELNDNYPSGVRFF
jgi:hypothetical protein